MRSYKFSKDDERPTEDKKAENERLMQEFLKKGGKIEKIEPMKPTKEQVKSWKI